MIPFPISVENLIFCWFGVTLSHVTSCCPTECNLYLGIYFETVVSELPYTHYNVPGPKNHIQIP
jgi:hypothetical protein